MSLDDALEHHRQGRLDDAEAAYRALIAAGEDTTGEAAFWLASLVEPAEAEEICRDSIARGHASGWTALGGLYRDRLDRPQDAERAYRWAAELGHADAWHDLGILLHQRGDLDGAVAAYSEAVRAGIEIANGNLGTALRDLGRAEEAEAAYRAAGPGFATHLGELLAAQPGRAPDAEQAFRAALQDGQAQALPGLAWLLYDQPGRDKDAEAVFEQDLKGESMLRGLGQLVARDAARAPEAEAILREAAIADPWALRPLAKLLTQQADRGEEAEAIFAAAFESGDVGAARALANELARRPGREADAERAYRLGIAAGDTGGYRNLGLLLQRTGRLGEAEGAFTTALRHGNARAYADLASVLLQLDRPDESTEYLRLAAAAGDELAQVRLALSLPEEEALAVYREAVDRGNQRAWLILVGLLSEHLREGTEPPGAPPDVSAGFEADYRERIRDGDTAALGELVALLAAQGRGDEAADAFREAAHAGQLDALIGVALLSGLSEGGNAQAEEALRAAAYVGNADASLLLGAFLSDKAAEEAARAYQTAIDGGLEEEGRRGLTILG